MKDLLKQFNLPNYLKGDSFAKDSKRITERVRGKDMEFSTPEDIATEQDLLGRLQQAQEYVKGQSEPSMTTNQYADGGFMDAITKYLGEGTDMGDALSANGAVSGATSVASNLVKSLGGNKGGMKNEATEGIGGAIEGAGMGAELGMKVGGPIGAVVGGVGLGAYKGIKGAVDAGEHNEYQELINRTGSYRGAYGASDFAFGGTPFTGDPIKKKNTANKIEGTNNVDFNGVVLNPEGQNKIFDKAYHISPDQPYLGKYGAEYRGTDGMSTKGGNIMSYKDGYVNFNKKYNQDMQEQYMDKVRALPENKGRDMYLQGSMNPKYMAPKGYQAGADSNQFALGGGPTKPPRSNDRYDWAMELENAIENLFSSNPNNQSLSSEELNTGASREPLDNPLAFNEPKTSSKPLEPLDNPLAFNGFNLDTSSRFAEPYQSPSFEEAMRSDDNDGRNVSDMEWVPNLDDKYKVRKMQTGITPPEAVGVKLGENSMKAPLTRFVPSDEGSATEGTSEGSDMSTALEQLARTAPALANMYNLSQIKRPKINASPKLSGKYKKNRVDEKSIQNLVSGQTAATREAILSSSGGSGSTARANLLAVNRQGAGALSDAYLKATGMNNAENTKAQQFDRHAAQVNLSQSNRDMDLNAADTAGYENNKSKLIAAIGQDFGSMGKEALFRKYPFLAGMDYDSYGKYINSKKDKK